MITGQVDSPRWFEALGLVLLVMLCSACAQVQRPLPEPEPVLELPDAGAVNPCDVPMLLTPEERRVLCIYEVRP